MSVLMSLGHLLSFSAPIPCSVAELRHQSPGYRYRVERIADFVESAKVIRANEASLEGVDARASWPARSLSLTPSVRRAYAPKTECASTHSSGDASR
jgi:hypothetical protein